MRQWLILSGSRIPTGPRLYAALFGLLLLILIAAASLWLRQGFPVFAIGPAEHDDFLFVRGADYLRQGEWLGPYDVYTLIKGFFYPLFIAGVSLLHVPLKMAEQAAYLAAVAAVSVVIARYARNVLLGGVLFAILAFNPMLWILFLARIVREGLYITLGLALFALTAALLFKSRRDTANWRTFLPAVPLGLLGAAFWLTREEGPWIIPALGALLAFAFYAVWIDDRIAPQEKRAACFRRSGIALAAFATAIAAICVVSTINRAKYEVFTDVEFKEPNFVAAYGAMNRVKPKQYQQYVVVPREVRERIYAVSPAANELRPYLEGGPGQFWAELSCSGEHLPQCPEIFGGFFMWALRGAAMVAGHHGSAREAKEDPCCERHDRLHVYSKTNSCRRWHV